MEKGRGTAQEAELLAATAVAGMLGVKETTVYRWCKEGKLPCLKVGKHWRIRREALEDFLKRSERPGTLVGQLDSFLRAPDNVLAIVQNLDILHRLDAAFFRVGAARDGLLIKFYAGEEQSEGELVADLQQNGLEVGRLRREGRFFMRPEEEPLGNARRAARPAHRRGRRGTHGVGLLRLGEAGRPGDGPGAAGGVDRAPRR
jgi:excisionase family DNA binding protein